MKIKPEHHAYMKSVIDNYIASRFDFERIVSAYEQGLFPNADKVQDLSKRFRWDLFHAAGLTKYACDVLYEYMDDTHIDTALRDIVPHKLIKSF